MNVKLGKEIEEIDRIVTEYIENTGKTDLNKTEFIIRLSTILIDCNDLDNLLNHFDRIRVL